MLKMFSASHGTDSYLYMKLKASIELFPKYVNWQACLIDKKILNAACTTYRYISLYSRLLETIIYWFRLNHLMANPGTIKEIESVIVPILKKNKVKKAGIFGSYSQGKQTRNSDIDILVEVKRGTGLFEFVGIKQELEEKLGKKVDLVTYNSIDPLLREEILGSELRII